MFFFNSTYLVTRLINCYTQHLCDVQIYILLIHFLHACITVELYPNYINYYTQTWSL